MYKQIYAGNTLAFTVQPKVDGVVQAIQGQIVFMVKGTKDDSDEDAVINETSTDGAFTVSADTTAELEPGRYWYELRWIFNDAVYTLDMGQIDVIKSLIG